MKLFPNMHNRKLNNKSRGIALLTVLPIITIMAVLIYYILDDERLVIQRVDFTLQKQRLQSIAEASESLGVNYMLREAEDDARNTFSEDSNSNNNSTDQNIALNNDSLQEPWAQSPFDFTSNVNDNLLNDTRHAEKLLYISDLNRFFNINNLHAAKSADTIGLDILYNIIAIDQIADTNAAVERLAYNILDWLDADDIRYGTRDSSEKDYYKNLGAQHMPPNRQINHISELINVDGMSEAMLTKLSAHVQAFPIYEARQAGKILYSGINKSNHNTIAININTSNEVIVAALVGKFFNGDAATVSYIRQRQGFFAEGSSSTQSNTADIDFEGLTIRSIITDNPLSLNPRNRDDFSDWVNVHSEYFLLQNLIQSEDLSINLLSYLYRQKDIDFDQLNFQDNIWVYQRQLAWNKLDI